MNWFKKNKEHQRFYLLPGMGGRALRRKRRLILQWSVAVGLIVSAIVCLVIYWSNSSHP